ncbi:MAG: hypothetical protein R6V05_01100 [Candidatus Brocadiia bacterium]
MRTLTYIKLVVLGALLLAAGLVVREVRRQTAPENVRTALLAELEGVVRGDVQIGAARFGLDGVVEAEEVAITAPDAEEPVLTCERIAVQLDRLQLLRGRKVPESVHIERPTLRLRRFPQERRWNLDDLRRRPKEVPGRPAPAGVAPALIKVEDATLLVTHPGLFPNGKPARYEGLYVELARDGAGAGSWSFEGTLRRGPLRGMELRGHFATEPQARLLVEASAESLQADRELFRRVPYGDEMWADYRPEGAVGVEGVASTADDGSLKYDFSVNVRDATFLTRFIAAPIEAASGEALISDRGVRVKDFLGTMPPEATDLGDSMPTTVRVEATQRWNGSAHHVIRATGLPLSRTVFEAIPGGGELWRRLDPDGRCDLHLVLDRQAGDVPMEYRAEARLHRVTLRPEELPLPLTDVEGTVTLRPDVVSLSDIRGTLRQAGPDDAPASAAHIRVDGTLGTRNGALELSAAAENLQLDESVLRAIPGAGEQIWRTARPEALVDAQISIRREEAGEDLQRSVQLRASEGRARLEFWPVPLHEISGTLRIEGDRLYLDDMKATMDLAETRDDTLRLNRLAASGEADLRAGTARLSLDGHNVTLNEELITSLPQLGQRIWEDARPEGLASFDGTLSYEKQRVEPVRCLLELDLRDVTLTPEAVPMPIHAVRGRALISERRLVADRLTAVSCSGELRTALVAYYGTPGELPSYAATVRFRELEFAELAGRWAAERPQMGGLLSGTVDVGGVLGGGTPLSMEGTVSLSEGRLWQTPFFARLINVLHLQTPSGGDRLQEGRARFTLLAGETTVHDFEVTGGGLHLSGYGSISRGGDLAGTMVAVGAPEGGGAIPIISSIIGWAMRGVERELLRVEVGGTLEDPSFQPETLARIMAPIAGLRSLLLSPFGEDE